jgi:hypothetical protein
MVKVVEGSLEDWDRLVRRPRAETVLALGRAKGPDEKHPDGKRPGGPADAAARERQPMIRRRPHYRTDIWSGGGTAYRAWRHSRSTRPARSRLRYALFWVAAFTALTGLAAAQGFGSWHLVDIIPLP